MILLLTSSCTSLHLLPVNALQQSSLGRRWNSWLLTSIIDPSSTDDLIFVDGFDDEHTCFVTKLDSESHFSLLDFGSIT